MQSEEGLRLVAQDFLSPGREQEGGCSLSMARELRNLVLCEPVIGEQRCRAGREKAHKLLSVFPG